MVKFLGFWSRMAALPRLLAFLVICLLTGAHEPPRPAGEPLSVGLLAQGVFWKGLFRDVEIVSWGEPRAPPPAPSPG